jgi:hypothetical protein
MVAVRDVERSVGMFKRYGVWFVAVTLFMAMAVPAAVAGPKGTDLPMRGHATGFALYGSNQDGGGTDGLLNVFDCDEAADIPELREFLQVTTYTSADGNATHMGNVHLEAVHCPGLMGPVNGQLAIMDVHGDVLYGEYQGMGEEGIAITFMPESTMDRTCHLLNDMPCMSTGRFADVSGTATWYADAVPGSEADPFVPWPWWGEWVGEINY